MRKEEYWAGLIREQRASGKSIARYCEERGVRPSQFWYWEKALSKGPGGKALKSFARVGELPRLEMVLKSGVILRLPADSGTDTLKQVLEALDAVGSR